MRDICQVINSMLQKIPMEEKTLRRSIEDIRDSALYCAPEAMFILWNRLSSRLNNYIPEINQVWQKEIKIIFEGNNFNGQG